MKFGKVIINNIKKILCAVMKIYIIIQGGVEAQGKDKSVGEE